MQFIGCCWDPVVCLVLEFMEHGSLDKLLWKSEETAVDLTWDEPMLRMAADCANGMVHVHSRNLIHRDIKSLNLLVGIGLGIKLADCACRRPANVLACSRADLASPPRFSWRDPRGGG